MTDLRTHPSDVIAAGEDSLGAAWHRRLADLGLRERPVHLLVALSGGCDSVVLLHLLRHGAPLPGLTISAAHVDHGMRAESDADAAWVRGLCRAWEVPLRSIRLDPAPATETGARTARYRFLRAAAADVGADLIATAHHADDQAETVLYRAVRGTGLRGLAGISGIGDGLVRPLLPFWREEIEAYAALHRLRWRVDASNADPRPTRNRLRLEILPRIEREVAPGARRSLVSLAGLAAEAEQALERIAVAAESDLVRWDGEVALLARDRLSAYDSAITSRLLRGVLRRFGVVLSRSGTRKAIQFITEAPSGRRLELPAGVYVETEFGDARILSVQEIPQDLPYRIDATEAEGEATVRIGGAEYRVRHGSRAPEPVMPGADGWTFIADRSTLRFPLTVRGRAVGDRIRTSRGGRSLKQVFLERRIPRTRRGRLPVLVDREGEVLWVAGVLRSSLHTMQPGKPTLYVTVFHA